MADLRVLSLGAGVQSTTLLLMAVRGEIDPFDVAVFADTGWEPGDVYAHLEQLRAEAAGMCEVVTVTAGDIRADLVANARGDGDRFASLPLYVTNQDGTGGMLRRQCTTHYKVEPIRRYLQSVRAGRRVRLVMGISLDEAIRMRDSNVRYITNEYPLVDRRMTRQDCIVWLAQHGYPTPPKSACIGCPFHDQRGWREIKADPESWSSAVEVDAAIRTLPRINGDVFLHRSRRPLAEVDLSTAEDRGQLPMFAMECEGLCGV